jgi:protein SCO1/2
VWKKQAQGKRAGGGANAALVSAARLGNLSRVMLKYDVIATLTAAVLSLAALSCRQDIAPAPAAAKTNLQIYQVKGVVKEVFAEKKKVKIAHEEIPHYMEAMTMLFDVRDAGELKGLQAGDSVSFRMLVTDDDGWIDQLKKLESPRTPLSSEPPPFRRVRDVEPLAVGDKLPDYTFTNALGRVVRLSEFRGRALGFTFIFTRCPFPTFCPRLSSNFAEAAQKLTTLSGGPTNWHLLSITIDPDYDTPGRLQAYAARYKADPKYWDFLTAALIDITAIGEQFGLQFWRSSPNEPVNHNVRTVVVDATGRIQWITPDNEWKPEVLVEQMIRAARATAGN